MGDKLNEFGRQKQLNVFKRQNKIYFRTIDLIKTILTLPETFFKINQNNLQL